MKFIVAGIVNDVGGSGVSLGEFDNAKDALDHLLNIDPYSTTPELVEKWIEVHTKSKIRIYNDIDEFCRDYNLEVIETCKCGAALAGWCSQCMGTYSLVREKDKLNNI